MSEERPKYTYSHNGEDCWTDDEDSAVDSAMFDEEDKTLESVIIYRGEAEPHTHYDFSWDVGADIIELLQESAYHEGSEFAGDYLEDVGKGKVEELSRLVTEWLNQNAAQPSFFGVKNITPYEVKL